MKSVSNTSCTNINLCVKSAQERVAQHTILQWSQAVSGNLFAAAFVAGATKSERFVIAAQFIFGLVIPAILLGGSLIAFCVLTIWWIFPHRLRRAGSTGCRRDGAVGHPVFSLGGTAPVLTDDELTSWMNGLNTRKAVLTQSGTLQWLQSYVLVRVRGTRSR